MKQSFARAARLPVLVVALVAMLLVPQAASAAVHSAARFSTFGTISTSGAVVDRFGVGLDFDALVFVPQNVGYGANLFYYVRHDSTGFSTFGTISTSGAVVDRFGVGTNVDALTF